MYAYYHKTLKRRLVRDALLFLDNFSIQRYIGKTVTEKLSKILSLQEVIFL